MCAFTNFCRKHYYAGFILFGIGGGAEVLSPHLPAALASWISPLGLFVMIFGAILLAVGLVMVGRQPKRDDELDPEK